MKNNFKILELGAEGGSITIFEFSDKENNTWYFHKVDEMGFEDIESISKNGTAVSTLKQALRNMLKEYKNAFSLYPLYLDKNHGIIIHEFLRQYTSIVDNNIDFNRWAELFDVDVEDIKK